MAVIILSGWAGQSWGVGEIGRFPGFSMASSAMQQRAAVSAIWVGRIRLNRDCKHVAVTLTTLDDAYAPVQRLPNGRLKPLGPWQEHWQVSGCGSHTWVKVRFITDSSGQSPSYTVLSQ